jgi:hypothetical protein
VARKPEPDSKWNEVEGQTIPIEDATLWVFNEWVERNNLAQRPIKNWEQQWKIWMDEGAEEELQSEARQRRLPKWSVGFPSLCSRT